MFILVQEKRALCQNNMFKQERLNAWLYKQVDKNIYKLKKDIYHATTQRDSNKLHKL